MNASRSSKNQSFGNGNLSEVDLCFDESVLQLMDEPFTPKVNASNLRTDDKYSGFDSNMGKTWIYPTNYPVRQYQHNISRISLFKNTLVVLPTGLGKTFIASVVMYNIFRWYPRGKIIFMAPTRPLVAQQIDACYEIMGFPKDETTELTGRQNKKVRAVAWRTKRVFYVTPQVVWSDMNDNEIEFPINDIKLIVVDEAHKAKGKYAYAEVVQSVWSRNKLFRVLALSATPGRNINDVCEVIKNLLISNVEVRRESSIDVAPYVFKKNIKTIVVSLDDQLTNIRQKLSTLVEPYVQNLMKHQVISGHMGNLTKAWLLFDRNKFRESTMANRHPEQSSINCDFSVTISMFHAIELLERHGLRVFLNYFNDGSTETTAEEKFFVMKDINIKRFIDEVRSESGITPFNDADMSFYGDTSNIDLSPIDYGHPKFEMLQNCLLEHFQANSDTKAIVFCEYRESVFLINRMLLPHRPLIKPKVFVGQGSSHSRTITQKEQIAIMSDFRSGKCNTLIATCVAEEGIDVGEVDFIVCFDVNNKNPIRFVQRIGRTGRKRQGKVTMLVTEGKEQQILREVLATKDGINQKIAKSKEIESIFYKNCPRLVPPEINPQCIETYINVKNSPEPSTSEKTAKTAKTTKTAKETKGKNAKTKKPATSRKGDMRNFFKPIEIDDDMEENFDLSIYRENTSTEHKEKSKNSSKSIDEELLHTSENELLVDDCPKPSEDGVPLHVKVQNIYNRYCDIKKDQSKWDGFASKISKSAKSNEQLPLVLKNYLTERKKRSNGGKVFKTSANQWPTLSDDYQTQIYSLLSMLKLHDKDPDTTGNLNQFESQQPFNENCDLIVESQNYMFIDSQYAVRTQQESKYASQMQSMLHNTLQLPPMPQMASSTPHKTSTAKPLPAALVHSPIVNNSVASRVKKPIDRSDPKWFLKYLGLNSAFDLFLDDGNESENNKSADHEAELCENLNKSICGNDSFIEESQYTVSRILKICEDAEKANNRSNENTSQRRRRLFIGSVQDLFRECDDEEDDDDVIINTQAMETSVSDDTVDYDVQDAMAQLRDLHNSTNLFKSSLESNKPSGAAKPVTLVKSDELFSTYNESMANASKASHNNASRNNASHNNASTSNASHSTRGGPGNLNKISDSPPRTPKKSNNSTSLFTYYNRSPSVLIKSSSILSNKFDNDQNISMSKTSSDNKSPNLLDANLRTLNSQLYVSDHSDDFDEIKENCSPPFATCRTARANQQQIDLNTSCDTELSEDDIFATCKPIPVTKKRIKPLNVIKKRKNRGKFAFIDDEAGVSGAESSDEDFIATQSSNLIVSDVVEEDDPSVDMRAKYLQSIRSPISRRAFRIPSIGYRNPIATQNIFSQAVIPDESRYEEDSFVVGSDEEESDDLSDSDCTELSHGDSTDFDEITITRPNKRKSDEVKQSNVRKRRRIIEMSSESD